MVPPLRVANSTPAGAGTLVAGSLQTDTVGDLSSLPLTPVRIPAPFLFDTSKFRADHRERLVELKQQAGALVHRYFTRL